MGDEWFDASRTTHLIALVVFSGLFLFFVWKGRKGGSLYIRPIDALVQMEDAVGRAAEMGKPMVYAPGLGSLTDPVTVASLNILSKVSEKGARLHTRTLVPNYGPLTWPVAQEVVRQAYARAGKSASFNPDDVPYFTSRSFTYAAATAGMMQREKSATNFFIGHFYSESLILAETGAASGALQIGGTDSVEQLPFFITTCDKVLIGEEIFAASALVVDDPVSRSVVKASDWFKVAILILFVLGIAAALLEALGVVDAFGGSLSSGIRGFSSGEWL
ncbi:MAG: hypothetical protein JXX29_22340 [Deltaproteobacteria bacterium]|nr:hypothetical protein [Deltaproteobacteria bacterium]MBN2674437.1 hypothetical protein [Deltaproteobacteria bacterium]